PPLTTCRALAVASVTLACFGLVHMHDPGDLDVYRAGGQAVLTGRPLYGVDLHGLGFTYPPFAGVLCTGLAALPRLLSVVLLTMSSLVALAVVLRYSAPTWWRTLRTSPGIPATAAIALLAASEPVRATLRFGQVDILLTALVLADLLSTRARSFRGAGVGIAAAVKLTPGIFVVFLLLRGRYREAGHAVAAFVAVSVAAAVLCPGASWRYWTQQLPAGSGIGNFASGNNNSISGLLHRSPLGSAQASALWVVLAAVAVTVGLASAVRLARAQAPVTALGIVGITGCVVSPVSWDHHWIWCIPWLIGLATERQPLTARARTGVLLAGAVFFGRDYVPGTWSRHCPPLHFVTLNAFVGVATVAAAVCMRGRFASRRRTVRSARAVNPVGDARRPSPSQVR
ncbi:glycosyltransferase 87 family protein, partial [uncultured Jatrophihabitans sp.]|uniref:glycosyltransferase 87 family protein n=1 Tax=uncultured Jatrophihabitans sp. TaxID=1610747 RepID=UPI0035CA1A12